MPDPDDSTDQDASQCYCGRHRPRYPTVAPGMGNLFLHFAPELRSCRELPSCAANASLQPCHLRDFRRTARALNEMFPNSQSLVHRQFTIEVGAEHRGGGVTLHVWASPANAPAMLASAACGRATGATSPSRLALTKPPQSPCTRALPCHSAKSSRDKQRAVQSAPS